MTFPVGMTTVECTIAQPVDFVDGAVLPLSATVEAVTPGTNTVTWAATGQELGMLISRFEQGGAITFQVPAVDQNGFIDSSGASFKEWAYRVVYQYKNDESDGVAGRPITKVFKAHIADAGTGIKIGLLPSLSASGSPVVGQSSYDVTQITGLETRLTQLANDVKASILGGAAPAYDTLKEIQDLLAADDTALAGLLTAMAGKADTSTVTTSLASKADLVAGKVPGSQLDLTSKADASALATEVTNRTSADTTINGVLNGRLSDATIAANVLAGVGQYKVWAKNPDQIVAGALTYTSGLLSSAVVEWPDGKAGVLTITARQAVTNAVLSYTITHVNGGTTLTYTQPTITRDSSGYATTIPQITVA